MSGTVLSPEDDYYADEMPTPEPLKTWVLQVIFAIFLVLAIVCGYLCIVTPTSGAYPQPPRTVVTVEPKYELIGYGIKDGDTLFGNIRIGFDIQLQAQDMRARDYDAWESHKYRRSAAVDGAVTDEEVIKGKKATEELQKWIGVQRVFISCKPERDTYGRWLVSFYRMNNDGTFTNFSEWMEANGHTRTKSTP